MKKKTLFQKNFIIGILVTVLAIACLSLSGQPIFASDIDVLPRYNVQLNKDKTAATISFDISQINRNKYEIQSIISKNDEKVIYEKDSNTLVFTYEVSKNGDYLFSVNYKNIIETSVPDEKSAGESQDIQVNTKTPTQKVGDEIEKIEFTIHIDQIVELKKEEPVQVKNDPVLPKETKVEVQKKLRKVSSAKALGSIYVDPNCPIVPARFYNYECYSPQSDGTLPFNGISPFYSGQTLEFWLLVYNDNPSKLERTFAQVSMTLEGKALTLQPAISSDYTYSKPVYADNLDLNNGAYIYLPAVNMQAVVKFRVTIPEDFDSENLANLTIKTTLGRASDGVTPAVNTITSYTVVSRPKFKNTSPIENMSIPLRQGSTLTQDEAIQYIYGYNGPSQIANTVLHESGSASGDNLGSLIKNNATNIQNATNLSEGTLSTSTSTSNLSLTQKTFDNTFNVNGNAPIAPTSIPLSSMGMYYTRLTAYDKRTMQQNKPYLTDQERVIVRRLWVADHYINSGIFHGLSEDFKIQAETLKNMSQTDLKTEVLNHIQGYQEQASLDGHNNVTGKYQTLKWSLTTAHIQSISGISSTSPASLTPYNVTVNVQMNDVILPIPVKVTVNADPSGQVNKTEFYRIQKDGSETLMGNGDFACSGETIKVKHYVQRNNNVNSIDEDFMQVNSISLGSSHLLPIVELPIIDGTAKSIINGTTYPISGDLKVGAYVKFAPNNGESIVEYEVAIPQYLDRDVGDGTPFQVSGDVGELAASDRHAFIPTGLPILSRPQFNPSDTIYNGQVALSSGTLTQDMASKILYSNNTTLLKVDAYKEMNQLINAYAQTNSLIAYNSSNGIIYQGQSGTYHNVVSQKTYNNEGNAPIAPTQIPLNQLGMYYTKLSTYDFRFGDYNTQFNEQGERTIIRRVWIADHYAYSSSKNHHGISRNFKIYDGTLHKMSNDDLKSELLKNIQVYLEKTTIDSHGNILGDTQAQKLSMNISQITAVRNITTTDIARDTAYNAEVDFLVDGDTITIPVNVTIEHAPLANVVSTAYYRVNNDSTETLLNNGFAGETIRVKHTVKTDTPLSNPTDFYVKITDLQMTLPTSTPLSIIAGSAKNIMNGTTTSITGDLKAGTYVKFAANAQESIIEYDVKIPASFRYIDANGYIKSSPLKISLTTGEESQGTNQSFEASPLSIYSRGRFLTANDYNAVLESIGNNVFPLKTSGSLLTQGDIDQALYSYYYQECDKGGAIPINIMILRLTDKSIAYDYAESVLSYDMTNYSQVLSQKTYDEDNVPIAPSQIPTDKLGMYYTKLSIYDKRAGDYKTNFNPSAQETVIRRMWIADHYVDSSSKNHHGISQDFKISDIDLHKMSNDELKTELLKNIQIYIEKATADSQVQKLNMNISQITAIRNISTTSAPSDTAYTAEVDFLVDGETITVPLNVTVYRNTPDCYVVIPRAVNLENDGGINSSYIGKETDVKLIETEKNTVLNILVQADEELSLTSQETSDTYTVHLYDEAGAPKPVTDGKAEIGILNSTTNIIHFNLSAKKETNDKSIYRGVMNYYLSLKN